MAAAPAAALELGEINVQSTLGQPLRASIAYALAPDEQIADYCITLKPGLANNGLPAITRANVSVADGIISLTGRTAIREPLMTLRVDVACPYTPNLSREYLLFIDPAAPTVAAEPSVTPAVVSAEPAAAAVEPAPAPAPVAEQRRPTAARSLADTTPIDGGVRYRVQPGDSLSLIAQRIDGREIGLWDAAARIFDANPGAFIDDDPNKLKAGSWLSIPDMSGGEVVAFSTETTEVPAARTSSPAADAAAANASVYEPAVTVSAPDTEAAPIAEPVIEPVAEPVAEAIVDDTEALAPAGTPVAEVSPVATLDDAAIAELETGDIIVEDTSVVIPDTELEAPALGDSPNGTIANIATPVEEPRQSFNWLYWLVGGGIALIAGLLMFGRRRKPEDDVEPVIAEAPQPERRRTDHYETMPELEELVVDDDDPTQENLALDADLVMGTGLESGIDVEVAEDFGFEGASAELDLEFPEEPLEEAETRITDIISAPQIEESSILESEILPDDDDYDMSVIVDATKMPDHEDVTQQDLKAVPVPGGDETLVSDSYTVSQEIDYQILEQDYEEELTATQALNMEIEKAAAGLAERLEADDDPTAEQAQLDENKTHELPMASVTELDVTANLQATDEDTAEIEATDDTAEMSTRQSDDTVEMEVESGTVDTKAL